MGLGDVAGRNSAVKFAEIVRVFPMKTVASRTFGSTRSTRHGIPPSRKLSEIAQLQKYRRESILQPERRSHVSHMSQPPPIQYQPNKRGILKCQAWQVQKMAPCQFPPSVSKNAKYKVQFPHVQNGLEIYCPRCDMYFMHKDDYLDHLLIRQYKAPFVEKINEVSKYSSGTAIANLEIHDNRNKTKMHYDKNRKLYKQEELLDEVRDLRDRARMMRKKRGKTRRVTRMLGPPGRHSRQQRSSRQHGSSIGGKLVSMGPARKCVTEKLSFPEKRESNRFSKMDDQAMVQLAEFAKKYNKQFNNKNK